MSSTPYYVLLYIDGRPLRDCVLGVGKTGAVVQRDGMALKLPLQYSTTGLSEDDIEYRNACAVTAVESIDREKEVYRRLGQHDGIVSCHDLSGIGLQMALMTSGSLHDYLKQQRPFKSVKLKSL